MDPYGTVTEKFRSVQPSDFQGEIERIWQAATRIKDTVVEEVANGNLSPIDGLGLVSCVTGQAFGYQQAHGQASQTDLLHALQPEMSRA